MNKASILTINVFILICCLAIDAYCAAGTGVLIDPGHSPRSGGTVSCGGKSEYLYNDALAEAVLLFLRAKNIPAGLTRSKQENITMSGRTGKSGKSRLLLSLHHDSVQPQYVYAQSTGQGYCSDKARGFSIFVSRKNSHYRESVQYAEALGAALIRKGLTPSLHHAEPIKGENRELLSADKGIYIFDDLLILKNAKTPALLLEAAVIVNPHEALISGTDAYRLIISEAVYEILDKGKISHAPKAGH